MRFPIPNYAKQEAKRALETRKKLPEYKKFGLDKKKAKKLGINSGVERARQIVRSKSLSFEDTKRVAAFYNRFKNKRTPRAEGAIDLWGGRRFGQSAVKFIKKQKGRK